MPHVHLTLDAEKIAWLTIDVQQSPVNVLSLEVLKELSESMRQLPKEAQGLVLCSGKPNGFIAGADIRMFECLKTPKEAKTLIEEGRATIDQLNRLPLPTVAMIEGFCLGGGLELALACRHRLALDDPKTRLGLPEVMLGIYPGWGGTVYLPRRIGDLPALQMMLTGKTVDARAAKKMGLVDEALPARVLQNAARAYAKGSFKPVSPPFWQRLPENRIVRAPIAKQLARAAGKRAPEKHYPAPYAILALWRDCAGDPLKAPAHHPGNIEQLAAHPTTANLLRVFRLQEALKAEGKSSAGVQRLHVIGAGTMGGDIAAWAALRGLDVTLADFSAKALAKSMQRAHQLFKRRLKAGHLVAAAMDRLVPDIQGNGAGNADVIIEAIVENEVAKKSLFQSIERQAKKEAILATNTSTIPLERLSVGLQNPARLVGLHFFNPVARMPLVEIVHSAHTDLQVLDRAKAFVGAIDRLPLLVKSAPGFLVNRILVPYLMEAMIMLEEGIPAATIDAAARDFGMPMGPIALADTVGLDICLAAGLSVKGTQQLGTSWVPTVLLERVRQGKLGVKSGEGFYRYRQGKPIGSGHAAFAEKHQWRLMLPFLNEAVAALRENIVEDADRLDAGVIFGTGFAPFRGGPIHCIRGENKQVWLHRMACLAERHGSRFFPDEGWNMI